MPAVFIYHQLCIIKAFLRAVQLIITQTNQALWCDSWLLFGIRMLFVLITSFIWNNEGFRGVLFSLTLTRDALSGTIHRDSPNIIVGLESSILENNSIKCIKMMKLQNWKIKLILMNIFLGTFIKYLCLFSHFSTEGEERWLDRNLQELEAKRVWSFF